MAKVLILDSNLLVLLVVGLTDKRYVAKHKRLSDYTDADFDLLVDLLEGAEIIVTPNTLTEASNLALQFGEPGRSDIARTLHALIARYREISIPSRDASSVWEFIRLGLADAAQLAINTRGHELLTADLDLYLAALLRNQEATNFNHLRSL